MPFWVVGLVLNDTLNAGILACFKQLSYSGSIMEATMMQGKSMKLHSDGKDSADASDHADNLLERGCMEYGYVICSLFPLCAPFLMRFLVYIHHTIVSMLNSLGRCHHYRRRCRVRAPCCNEIFDCRHCHNEAMVSVFSNMMLVLNFPVWLSGCQFG